MRLFTGIGRDQFRLCDAQIEDGWMCNAVLARLREEHGRFELLFAETERQCAAIEVRDEMAVLTLTAIAWYFTDGTQKKAHQALENRLAELVLEHVLGFAQDIYDVDKDHQTSRKRATAFADSLKTLAGDPIGAQKGMVRTARAFIGHERGHFMSEEEILFPYALRYLTPGESAELQRQSEAQHWDVIDHPEHAPILRTLLRSERA